MTDADVFAAIADPTRRSIVEMLAKGDLSAGQISEHFDVSMPAISQHLKVLRDAKVVTVQKRAQQRIYSLNQEPMQEVQMWIRHLAQEWEERFDALERLLEREKKQWSQQNKK